LLLTTPGHLVTLTCPPGIGKTQLALATGARLIDAFPTYTVSLGCIETEVDTGPGSIGTQHYQGFLSPDGSQMMFIQTDKGIVSAGTLIRVASSAIGS
jgi:hypothetical protein